MANGTITRFPGETDVEFQFRQQAQGKALAFAQQVPGRTTPPPQTFEATQLEQPSQVNLPTPEEPGDSISPFVSSLEPTQMSIQQQVDQAFNAVQEANAAATQPIQEERTGLTARLQERLGALTGRATRQQEIEQQLEIPQNIKQLQEVNLQLAQRKGEFEKAIAAIPGQGRGVPTRIVAGQQARARRQAAVELGAQASVAQALQGNIALAQQTADRTVAVEFEGIEQEIQGIQQLLDINRENFSRAERRQAEQLDILLNERTRLIADAKEERRNVLNFAAQAAQNGAPNDVVNRIAQSQTTEAALGIGSEFLAPRPTEFELEKQKLELEERRLRIRNVESQISTRGRSIAANTSIPVIPDIEVVEKLPTFQEFIADKQEQLQQSIADPEQFRDEYNNLIAGRQVELTQQEEQRAEQLVGQLSEIARAAYKNDNVLETITPTAATQAIRELESIGLVPGGLGRKQENKLRSEFSARSKDFIKQRDSIERVRGSAVDPSAAGDLALIFNFMKVLDPGSVVRESEFATAANAGGVPDRVRALYNRVVDGKRLSRRQRRDFVKRAEILFTTAQQSQGRLESEYRRLSNQADVSPENVIVNFGTGGVQNIGGTQSLLQRISPEQRAELQRQGLL